MNAPVRTQGAGPIGPWRQDWVYRQRTVESFNGRRGDICLTPIDIVWAGGAPIMNPVFLGAPSAQCSPPMGDASTRFATTEWVMAAIDKYGLEGPQGPAGPPGHGLTFLGSVTSKNDLPATGNEPGDSFIAIDTGQIWLWDGQEWLKVEAAPPGPPGERGPQGPTGPTGPTGPQGREGERGREGPQGPQGPIGPQGIQGVRGLRGEPGKDGTGFYVRGSVEHERDLPTHGNREGDTWIIRDENKGVVWDGESWVRFNLGETGPQGPQGEHGEHGAEGPRGIQGPQGPQGIAGAPGAQGVQGAQGPAGTQGIQGQRGERGETGSQGAQGPVGPAGPHGERGERGEKGETGERGQDFFSPTSPARWVNAGGTTVLTATPIPASNVVRFAGSRDIIDVNYSTDLVTIYQHLKLSGLPTSYPGDPHIVWNHNGTLRLGSAGGD